MRLYFVTNAHTPAPLPGGTYELRQSVAVLGSITAVRFSDLVKYVKMFPQSWVEL